jgi:hypothetical protein
MAKFIGADCLTAINTVSGNHSNDAFLILGMNSHYT